MSALMKPKLFYRWGLSLLLSLGGLQACSAETDTPAQNWPTECVGRMQMRLPGPADTAAFSFIKMQDYIKRGGYPNGFTFADGVPAPFAQSIAISHPLTDTNKEQLKLLLLAEKSEVASRNAVRRKKEGAAAPYFGDLPSPPFDRMVTMGWQFKETVAVRQFVGDSLLVKSEKLSNASRLANAPARHFVKFHCYLLAVMKEMAGV